MSQAENVEINAFCLNFQGLNYIIKVRKYDLKYEFIYISKRSIFVKKLKEKFIRNYYYRPEVLSRKGGFYER